MIYLSHRNLAAMITNAAAECKLLRCRDVLVLNGGEHD
jgi:hypothetical protein